jgi:hypothetical protein
MGLWAIAAGGKGGLYCLFRRYVRVHHQQLCHLTPLSGSPADASFEAELLARTRHCQLFVFDHTASSLPRALSTPTPLPIAFGEFYSAWDVSSSPANEHDYWDSRGTAQRSHFRPYRIAGTDAHATGDNPKTYTLESLMRQNGAPPSPPPAVLSTLGLKNTTQDIRTLTF